MQAETFSAFWSYTHEDNDRSNNRVLALAEALKDEFALSTGDELGLFVDRSSLAWGDAWRERIGRAVSQVPFFIPVVTPKFVRSEECRREFLSFNGYAKSRNLDKLLLPILYIDVPGLHEDSDDEVLALIARTQYVDWRSLRLRAANDPGVLNAIHGLAIRLRDLQSETSEVALEQEARSPKETSTELGNSVDAIYARFEPWMEAVEFDKIAGALWRASLDERLARISRLRTSHAPGGAVLSTLVQLGKELLPIAENRLEKAKTYARLTIELDPLVSAAIRLASLHRDKSSLLNRLRDGVNEAYLNIDPPESQSGYGMPSGLAEQTKHLGDAERAMQDSYAFVKEGNSIVLSWREKLKDLDGPSITVLV